MKKNRFITYILAFCFLTGCGQPISQSEYSSDDALAVMATNESETQAPTESVTEARTALSEPPEGVTLTANDIEVYSEVTISELITGADIEPQNGDELVDTSETGDFEVTVSYTYEDKLYEHPVSYTVLDTTPPTLLNSGGGAVVEAGKNFDLNDYVGFADNYDRVPELTYTGYVDTSVCGTYPLTATVTDSSDNETSWDLNIKVVNEIPTPVDDSPRLSFDSFTEQYSNENVTFGIDVSKWQGNIDFEAVKNAGCEFVIMRMGHYYDEITMDEYYKTNMEKAKAAGLDVGVYIYTTANTEEEIKENAKWIADTLDGQELDFPVVFDWENFSNFQQYEMSINDLNELFVLFDDEMKQYGYSAMLYSSKNFLNNFWYEHSDYPIWLAHYTDQTDYTGEYDMWQLSSVGRIDGIDGDVDLNILYTDKMKW